MDREDSTGSSKNKKKKYWKISEEMVQCGETNSWIKLVVWRDNDRHRGLEVEKDK